MTDKNGITLSVVITAANTHDMKAAIETLDSIAVSRPKKKKQNLCLDKGYDFPEIEREAISRRRYVPHIRHRREKKHRGGGKRRRWVVERTNSWHHKIIGLGNC
ncbi:MAG TPA: transposase [Nitrososphaera sp.]|nr:transposase [Nitrososphaera sp.]